MDSVCDLDIREREPNGDLINRLPADERREEGLMLLDFINRLDGGTERFGHSRHGDECGPLTSRLTR